MMVRKDIARWARTQWDRVSAVACVAAGAVALLIGWLGVSDAVYPAAQIPFVVSGGLVGIFLVGIGGVLWLSADLRDEWRELHRIEEHLAARSLEASTSAPPEANGHGARPNRTKPLTRSAT
jgi:hypothetical protein